MKANENQPFAMAVVSAGQESCTLLESALRDAGLRARGRWFASVEDFVESGQVENLDLLLCEEAQPIGVLMASLLDQDLPVIILGAVFDESRFAQALQSGACGYARRDDKALIEHLCRAALAGKAERQQHVAMTQRVHTLRSHLRAFTEKSEGPMALVVEGIITESNPAFASRLNLQPHSVLSTPLLDHIAPAERKLTADKLRHALRTPEETVSFQAHLHTSSGVTAAHRIQMMASHRGEVRLLVKPLGSRETTGLPQRRALFERYDIATRAISNQRHACIMVGLDGYSDLQRRVGFLEAEQTLYAAVDALRPEMSPADQVFQFAAGTLALLCSRSSAEDFEALIEAFRSAVAERPLSTDNHESHVTATVVGHLVHLDEPLQRILSTLQVASEQHAAAGGDRAQLIDGGKAAQGDDDGAVRARERVRTAIEEDRLRVVYHPIQSLDREDILLYDSHVRMFDAQGYEFMAAEFLPVAKAGGLMPRVDQWVCMHTIKTLAEDPNHPSEVFIRVSEETLRRPREFVEAMLNTLREQRVSASRIVFEIPQATVIHNHADVRTLMSVVGRAGIRLVIEQFDGSDRAMAMITDFSPAFLKLLPALTQDLAQSAPGEEDETHQRLLPVARERNIQLIADHLTDANSMARLWKMGINLIQGHPSSGPVAENVEAATPPS